MTYRSYRSSSAPRSSGPRANQRPGPCATCGDQVPAGQGILTGSRAAGWAVRHVPQHWAGSPVSGWYAGGCPRDTAQLNAQGGWGPERVRTYVPPVQVAPDDAREASRLAGGKYAYTASGARMTLSSARCTDAPCCGCCD